MSAALGLILALASALAAAPQDVPDPHWPKPVLDRTAPRLPPLRRPAVLIFSKTNGFRHDSIPDAVRAVAALVRKRGWSAYATENGAVFNPAQLARFDVIVFASATGDLFTPDQRAAFGAWLARGRGFVALHGAGDGSHPAWYQKLLGYSGYTGHPGGKDQFQTGTLVVQNRSHPATRHLPARWRWTEEYYAYAAPPAADAHVLARLDEQGMRLESKHRMGERHALIWWRCQGRTRIFYSALGHQREAWSDAAHLTLIDGALVWTARKAGKGCN